MQLPRMFYHVKITLILQTSSYRIVKDLILGTAQDLVKKTRSQYRFLWNLTILTTLVSGLSLPFS